MIADVKNTGRYEGDEVAELYLVPPDLVGAPRLSLQGVRRVHLQPGETKQVEFILSPQQMSVANGEGKRAIHPGRYRVFVGGSQPDDPAHDGVAFDLSGELSLAP